MLKHLASLVENGTLPHTLLFAGPLGAGKKEMALKLASLILGGKAEGHPDLYIYQPDAPSGMHAIETLRSFTQEVYMAPFTAPSKVFILEDADKMLPSGSNALLKTLEEPSAHAYIILLTTQKEALLSTIVSRVRMFNFHLYNQPVAEKTEREERLVALLGQITPYADQMKALALFDDEENPEKVLGEVLWWHRDRHLLARNGDPRYLYFQAYLEDLKKCTLPLIPLPKIFDKVEKARFALQQHVKLKTCLEHLLLSSF